jgi:DNA-directed RNA polymerase subunit K/omega
MAAAVSSLESLTKYEKTRVVSTRIMELELNNRPLVPCREGETLFSIAMRELEEGKLSHILVNRVGPGGRA